MSEILHLLQVEDSASDAALIVRLLQRGGFQVQAKRVEESAEMLAALSAQPWDVIICDHRMAHFDAPGALRILHEAGLDIPFIVVSGSIGEDLAVSLMKAGAHDYLLKDNLARLAPAVEREVREARMRQQRLRADQELQESKDRLAFAVDAIQLGTFELHPQTGRVILSESARRHFGLPSDGTASFDAFLCGIHPKDRERIQLGVQSVLHHESGGRYAAEYRTIGIEDGIERWISVWGRVFFDASEQPVRFVGVTLDVTERKKLEEEFWQSQKLESIGRLAGGVAHDFNNFLTVISGYAQLVLSERTVHHPLRGRIEEISKAATRACELTRQLLTFSSRHATEPKKLVVNDLLRNFENMLRRLLGERVDLVLAVGSEPGVILADPGRIEQVIMNLAINARDAMPAGGRLLIETSTMFAEKELATAHPTIEPGRYVIVAVSDTGMGMAPEVQAHIFEPFFTTKEQGKGTGLGLSTVYGIVKQCGGSILVSSAPGRGTTFKLLFPAVEGGSESPDVVPVETIPSGNNETILVAEDEAGVRQYVRHVLEDRGYRVLAACNGAEAVALARMQSGAIDLLLTDVVMPGMSGPELIRQFASECPGIPVLCMSGYSQGLLTEAELASNLLQKPFSPAALLTRIQALLQK